MRDQLRRRNERVTEQYMVQVRLWLPVSKSCSRTRVIASGDARHALAIAAAKDQADIIAIAPRDDVEIRRVTLLNESGRTREIDLTSYAEVVLAPAAHERHPAFSKLFVHSERLAEPGAFIFTRRPQPPRTGLRSSLIAWWLRTRR
nr:hypothetical protein [Aurantimonas marina]